jgi:sugar/nucleoside kinase (ribokinase family)
LAGGNFIIDVVKLIDGWPGQESLATIRSQSASNGGGPYNVLKDLARMQADFPLEAAGLIGTDEWGDWMLRDCEQHGIDTHGLHRTPDLPTAYTDVMTVQQGGKRTFFHNRGTNQLLADHHFALQESNALILYLAYLMLLDTLDTVGPDGKSGAARVLERAKAQGMMTATDLVSVNTDDFRYVVSSSLPYVDYLFVNEFEAAKLTQIYALPNGHLDPQTAEQACQALLNMGVREWVILHCPQGVVAMRKDGVSHKQGSVEVPPEAIMGTVGAGDAFAAGVLFGLHEQWSMPRCLELGVCVAASSLLKPTCSDSILPWRECLEMGRKLGYRTFLTPSPGPMPSV